MSYKGSIDVTLYIQNMYSLVKRYAKIGISENGKLVRRRNYAIDRSPVSIATNEY